MNRLAQAEEQRVKFLQAIAQLLGISVDQVSVNIAIHSQPMEGSLDTEATSLGWDFDCLNGCAQSSPDDHGSITLFLLERERDTEWVG